MKVRAIILIMLSYMFAYLTPIVASFFLLAEGAWKSEEKHNLLFLTVVMVVFMAFAVKVTLIINKQEANHFKTIFKAALFMGFMWLILGLFDYMTFNIDKLRYVIWATTGGYALSVLFKTIAIHKYTDFVRKLGVF